jgi:hypothetical protein
MYMYTGCYGNPRISQIGLVQFFFFSFFISFLYLIEMYETTCVMYE